MSTFDEISFVKAYVESLSPIPVTYPDDFQPAGEHIPRKIPVFQVDILPPPDRRAETSQTPDTITVTVKSLKPSYAFALTVQPTDTISSIKDQLAAQPRAPPAEWQRLLLRGKALTDSKLLKEYAVEDGATINLMIKPGFTWTGQLQPDSTSSPSAMEEDASSRSVPSLVISGTPARTTPLQVQMDPPRQSPIPSSPNSYQSIIISPAFWNHLHEFLLKEFVTREDADAAFEEFLIASKGSLSVQDIAKIRDAVGVVGMAGT